MTADQGGSGYKRGVGGGNGGGAATAAVTAAAAVSGGHEDGMVVLTIVVVVIFDGGERVEGCGLGLWWFVSHMRYRCNIFPNSDMPN